MPLTINDEKTSALAEELAGLTGETVPQTVRLAIEERLRRLRTAPQAARSERRPPAGLAPADLAPAGLADELDRIALDCARLPVRDDREADVILGYDEHGLPA